MIQFASDSKWPRRLRNIAIAFAVLVAAQAIFSRFAKRYIEANGGEQVYRTTAKLKGIAAGLTSVHFIRGKYPADQKAFITLFSPPPDDNKFHLPHLSSEPRHTDSWKREFRYRCPGVHNPESYDLWSVGADGIDGTEDDITNW